MKIELGMWKNKKFYNGYSLCNLINSELGDNSIVPELKIGNIDSNRLRIDFHKLGKDVSRLKIWRDISQLYSIITNAGYSIKKPKIIKEDRITKDKQRLANDYLELKARSKENNWK